MAKYTSARLLALALLSLLLASLVTAAPKKLAEKREAEDDGAEDAAAASEDGNAGDAEANADGDEYGAGEDSEAAAPAEKESGGGDDAAANGNDEYADADAAKKDKTEYDESAVPPSEDNETSDDEVEASQEAGDEEGEGEDEEEDGGAKAKGKGKAGGHKAPKAEEEEDSEPVTKGTTLAVTKPATQAQTVATEAPAAAPVTQAATQAPKTTTQSTTVCEAAGARVNDGETLDKSPFWFKCVKGQFNPEGCLTDESTPRRVKFGQNWVSKGYQLSCLAEPDLTSFRIEATACVHEKKKFAVGESYQDQFFWYTCAKGKNNVLEKKLSGCIDEAGKRVSIGGQVETSNYIFECRKSDSESNPGGLEFAPLFCLKDGTKIKLSETFVDGKFWYTCIQENGFVAKKLSGCADETGKKLNDAERYYKSGFVIQCDAKPGSSVSHNIVGCLPIEKSEPGSNPTEADEKKIGDTWISGQKPFQFLVQCEKLKKGARQSLVMCHYDGDEGSADLEPGCFRNIGDVIVTCASRQDGGLNINAVEADSDPDLSGLEEC